MQWAEDREPFDVKATAAALALAVGITVALTVFVVLVLAGVFNWAAAVAGL